MVKFSVKCDAWKDAPTTHGKIIFQDVWKNFGKKEVLRGINFSVESSRSLVVLGPSGTGKSVLLKCLLNLIRPSYGKILVDGILVTKNKNTMKNFGVLFQGSALFDSLTVWRNVIFGVVSQKNIRKKDAKELAINILEKVGLAQNVADLYPAELSGGMRKRVALARAIATKPEIILFDEPTTGLDPIMSQIINDLIVDCVKELGATTITITHDISSCLKIADDIVMIYNGKVVWKGFREELEMTDNPYINQFTRGLSEGPIRAL